MKNSITCILIVGTVITASAVAHSESTCGLSPKSYIVTSTRNGAHVFYFSPRVHRWCAITDGVVIRSEYGSGGKDYCHDIRRRCHTPVGSFRLLSKQGAQCRSTRYPIGRGGAPMPYCMFFTGMYAIHGSHDVQPGRNASHGCIRIYPEHARWLYYDFLRPGDKVIVSSY